MVTAGSPDREQDFNIPPSRLPLKTLRFCRKLETLFLDHLAFKDHGSDASDASGGEEDFDADSEVYLYDKLAAFTSLKSLRLSFYQEWLDEEGDCSTRNTHCPCHQCIAPLIFSQFPAVLPSPALRPVCWLGNAIDLLQTSAIPGDLPRQKKC